MRRGNVWLREKEGRCRSEPRLHLRRKRSIGFVHDTHPVNLMDDACRIARHFETEGVQRSGYFFVLILVLKKYQSTKSVCVDHPSKLCWVRCGQTYSAKA